MALYSGQRCCTISHVCLGDLAYLVEHQGRWFLNIKMRFQKGDHNSLHACTFSGWDNKEDSTMDLFYWLDLWLKEEFKLDLKNLAQWKLSTKEKQTPLFKWSKDSMSDCFRRRAEQTGFPKGMLTFHGFRGGFISCAMMNQGLQDNPQAAYDSGAHVANWEIGGKAQRLYTKTLSQRALVCNDLLMQEGSAGYHEVFKNSLVFHQLTTLKPKWEQASFKDTFKLALERAFKNISSSTEKQVLKKKCGLEYYKSFCPYLLKKSMVEELLEENPRWKKAQKKNQQGVLKNIKRDQKIKVARELIQQDLAAGANLEIIMKDYLFPVQEELKKANRKPPKAKTLKKKQPTPRTAWKDAEDRVLVRTYHQTFKKQQEEAKRKGKTTLSHHWITTTKLWSTISEKLEAKGFTRSNQQCRDRWRNLIRIHGSQQEVFTLF